MSPDSSVAPDRGSRYRIVRELGRGGMAAVYEAVDRRSARTVALKRALAPDDAGDGATQRALFEREYHTLAQLRHPCIIEVYDYEIDELGPYYTMELVEGADLREQAPLEFRAACRHLRDVASSLALLHSRRLVHRDVTPRNVRCTVDGRSKLIDFGALVSMGRPTDIVGTPSYIAPEVLYCQPVDGQADLFALGATAYWALARRHAYPARALADLPALWENTPARVGTLVPGIPKELDRLVMELVSVDPAARPRSAMEVIERLTAIAGLAEDERLMGQAYLTTPRLAGREKSLEQLARALTSARDGRGRAVLIQGAPGLGRSRLLASGVLEAKLAGFTVVRVDASDALAGDYAVAAELVAALVAALPEAWQALGQDELVIRKIVPHLGQARLSQRPAAASMSRRDLQLALRNWIGRIAAARPVLVAVDDVHRCDEPSAALLALLAESCADQRLALVLTVAREYGAAVTPAVSVLETAAEPLELAPLTLEQTRDVLRSVFGDAAHLTGAVDSVHAVAGGSPAACMLLAQHLVDTQLARYERGAWVLPERLELEALPAGMEQALDDRLLELSRGARTLAHALALAAGRVRLEDLTNLLPGGHVHRALDELLVSGVLVQIGQSYTFAQSAFIAALERSLSAELARTLHGRILDVLVRVGEHPILLAHHAFGAGRGEQGLQFAFAFFDRFQEDGQWHPRWMSHAASVLERALEVAVATGVPLARQAFLRLPLISLAMYTDIDLAVRHGPHVEAQLRRDLGLQYWDELSPALPMQQRVFECLRLADEAYARVPESEQGLAPMVALKALVRFAMYRSGSAARAQDAAQVEQLIELVEPFCVLPIFRMASTMLNGIRDSLNGFLGTAAARFEETLALLEDCRSVMSEGDYTSAKMSFTAALVQMSLPRADPRIDAWLAELQNDPLHEASAWRLRETQAIYACDLQRAAAARHQAELSALQNSGLEMQALRAPGTVTNAVHLGDLAILRPARATVCALAERYSTYVPLMFMADGAYHALRGDFAASCTAFAEAHRLAPVGRYTLGHVILAYYVRSLVLAERGAEAKRVVDLALASPEAQRCERENRRDPMFRNLLQAIALAEAAHGDPARARETRDALLDHATVHGSTELSRARYFETAALVSLLLGDAEGCRRALAALRAAFQRTQSPHVFALLRSLEKRATDAETWSGKSNGSAPPLADQDRARRGPSSAQGLRAIAECANARDKRLRALDVLLLAGESPSGYLYGVDGERLTWNVASADQAAPETLVDELRGLVREYASLSDRTESIRAEMPTTQASARNSLVPAIRCAGQLYRHVLVERCIDGELELIAIAAVQVPLDRGIRIPAQTVMTVARVLSQ